MPVFKIDFNLIEKSLKQLSIELKQNNETLVSNELINELKLTNDLSLNTIKYANKTLVKRLMTLSNQTINGLHLIEGNSDLIPDQYEGGFKLWEGLHDIINYLIEFNIINNYISDEKLNILEVNIDSIHF